MKLTMKQENFCQGIIKGLNQSEAYRAAYNCEKTKDSVVWTKASKLMRTSVIIARLQELRSKIEERLIYTALESFNRLNEIQNRALENKKLLLGKGEDGGSIEIEDPDFTSALKAEELKGKLAGLYVEKKEIGGLDTSPIKIEIVE